MHTLNIIELIKFNSIQEVVDDVKSGTDLSKIDLIHSLGLIHFNPNLSEFRDRLCWGESGEKVFILACLLGIISCEDCRPGFSVKSNDVISSNINAVNGDAQMIFPYSGHKIQFVDVKNTEFVSLDSIQAFNEEGWYFFNAFQLKKKQHFLILNNQAFKDWVMQYPAKSSKPGYIASFKDLPSDPKSFGIVVYSGIDVNAYHRLLQTVRVQYELRGLDFASIIKLK